MEEAAGSDRVDSQGTADLEEVHGTIANSASGFVDNAVDFESADARYLRTPSTAGIQSAANYTVAFHVRFESLPTSQWMLNKWGNDTGEREWVLRYENAAGGIQLIWYLSGGTSDVRFAHSTTISTATWYSIIFWRNSDSNKINISINGDVESLAGATSFNASSDTLRVGARVDGFHATQQPMDGLMDQLFIWQDTLTVANRNCLDAGVDYEDL